MKYMLPMQFRLELLLNWVKFFVFRICLNFLLAYNLQSACFSLDLAVAI